MYKNVNELKKMSLMEMADYLLSISDDSLEYLNWYENHFMPALDEKYDSDCTTVENQKHFSNLLNERARSK